VASRLRTTGAAWTTAILKVDTIVHSFRLGELLLLYRYDGSRLTLVHEYKAVDRRWRRSVQGTQE
jgi:hypothetical protein